ncbi:MAG: hypothetical protein OEM49_04040, partial [Myxococcales bacterium]|nr:hypothetical protein [Myxococcales bacterium]
AWYHGTIDLAANDDGDGTLIDNEPFTEWYDFAGVPARNLTGFYYSAIAQGFRPGPVSGFDPTWSPNEIYNGDFEIVNDDVASLGIGYAGWRFHGGDKAGTIIPWSFADPPLGSTYYLTLFAGSTNDTLTHNRLYVDESVGGIELTRRIAIAFRLFFRTAWSKQCWPTWSCRPRPHGRSLLSIFPRRASAGRIAFASHSTGEATVSKPLSISTTSTSSRSRAARSPWPWEVRFCSLWRGGAGTVSSNGEACFAVRGS